MNKCNEDINYHSLPRTGYFARLRIVIGEMRKWITITAKLAT